MRVAFVFLLFAMVGSVSAAPERGEHSAKHLDAEGMAPREQPPRMAPQASLAGAPLVALEQQMVEAEKSHNLRFIESTLAPDFLEIAGNGRLYTKAEIMDVVKDIEIQQYKLENFHVLMLRDEVGIVTYEIEVRASYKGQSFPGRNHLSSTWRREKDRWQMVFHTSVPMPQPPGGTAELVGLESDLVAREVVNDAEWLKHIVADDVKVIGSDGKHYDKESFLENIARDAKIPRRISDFDARMLSSDTRNGHLSPGSASLRQNHGLHINLGLAPHNGGLAGGLPPGHAVQDPTLETRIAEIPPTL